MHNVKKVAFIAAVALAAIWASNRVALIGNLVK